MKLQKNMRSGGGRELALVAASAVLMCALAAHAEDAYVAEYLTDDAEGEDPDGENDPPGVSDDEANAPNDDGALEDEEEPDVDRGLAPLTADEPAW